MDNARISADQLAEKLAASKRIMNRVEDGDYETGAINQDILTSNPEELVSKQSSNPMNENSTTTTDLSVPVSNPSGIVDEGRINKTKLPDAIKKAMIESPIQQIGLSDTLDMDIVNKAKRLMEQDGMGKISKTPNSRPSSNKPISNQPQKSKTITSSELERRLTPIIENVTRKTIDSIMDKKLEQILMAQNSVTINENLAIKVGNTIFSGKITKSKSVK